MTEPTAMSDFSETLKERSMVFATSVLRLVDNLPTTIVGRVVGTQSARCSTSVVANYRGACNARSRREFVAKLGIVVEEADESTCWLELIRRRALLPVNDLRPVLGESVELRNIFGKSLRTARENLRRAKAKRKNQSLDQLTNQLTR